MTNTDGQINLNTDGQSLNLLNTNKDQYNRGMKEPVLEDLIHKKLSSFFMDNIKLHKRQLIGLH